MATTADLVPAVATWCEPAPPVVGSTWGDGLRGVFLMPVLICQPPRTRRRRRTTLADLVGASSGASP
jgi:hypothetical protein